MKDFFGVLFRCTLGVAIGIFAIYTYFFLDMMGLFR